MKKKILSLALALALCLGLAAPAFAAGTTETVTAETYGVVITMDGFLRKETQRYMVDGRPLALTIYVVADNSTITVEAMEGRKYRPADPADDWWYNWSEDEYAYWSQIGYIWDDTEEGFVGVGGGFDALTGPETATVSPSDRIWLKYYYGIAWLCESDYAKLVPFEGEVNAAKWAQETLKNAYDANLFPDNINPFEVDCTRGMTRAEFAAVAVNLYAAMQGVYAWELDLNSEHPFTDVEYDSNIGYAYNLGIVEGSGTTFFPNTTLTREQAAVMLARVYAKIYGDIPIVTATSFADNDLMSSWAKSSVAFMADKGIVDGVGNNNFAPKNTLSIQEAVVMAQRMLENMT